MSKFSAGSCSSRSCGPKSNARLYASQKNDTARCAIMTPFGVPVEPEVYRDVGK